jgi:hypothetical protein
MNAYTHSYVRANKHKHTHTHTHTHTRVHVCVHMHTNTRSLPLRCCCKIVVVDQGGNFVPHFFSFFLMMHPNMLNEDVLGQKHATALTKPDLYPVVTKLSTFCGKQLMPLVFHTSAKRETFSIKWRLIFAVCILPCDANGLCDIKQVLFSVCQYFSELEYVSISQRAFRYVYEHYVS